MVRIPRVIGVRCLEYKLNVLSSIYYDMMSPNFNRSGPTACLISAQGQRPGFTAPFFQLQANGLLHKVVPVGSTLSMITKSNTRRLSRRSTVACWTNTTYVEFDERYVWD